MRMSLSTNEEVVVECKARIKGQIGTLYLTSQRLFWTNSPDKQLSLPFETIKKHQVSVGSEKVLMKVEASNSQFVFEFVSNQKEKDRQDMKEQLGKKLKLKSTNSESQSTQGPQQPPTTNSNSTTTSNSGGNQQSPTVKQSGITVPIREREQILKKDADVQRLYNELVGQGILSAEEFWSNRAEMMKRDAPQIGTPNQVVGISSTLTNTTIANQIAPIRETDDKVLYQLTAQTIHKIFVEYPAVRLAYKQHVPTEMSEQEFWTKFFQSQYFAKKREGEGGSKERKWIN
eukprot:TRINITY_DN5097_c1_g1_i1.p3 TRINITY_DN5097_c1_g1~~TRINITY_DN5097_c1_g1_i1.p3  ORF type:complete len:288 (-),score=77.53 TRINITY_DN5097_c1_g1_i1:2529-3392(-)